MTYVAVGVVGFLYVIALLSQTSPPSECVSGLVSNSKTNIFTPTKPTQSIFTISTSSWWYFVYTFLRSSPPTQLMLTHPLFFQAAKTKCLRWHLPMWFRRPEKQLRSGDNLMLPFLEVHSPRSVQRKKKKKKSFIESMLLTNQPTSEWINEWMNEQMNEWMNDNFHVCLS